MSRSEAEARREWRAWREARLAAVGAVPGNLALVDFQPIGSEPGPVASIPGLQVSRVEGQQAALVVPDPGVECLVDGVPVSGPTAVDRLTPAGGPLVQVGRRWFDVFSLDGTDVELRVYDERAEAVGRFNGIEVYDFDPGLVVGARFTTYDEPDAVAWDFTRSSDSGHIKSVPGVLELSLGGRDHHLLTFLDGDQLVLVFADGTTGAESYAPGRFLRVPPPAADGAVRVDFNRAFIPPCGFSAFYSCPIPPPANRVAARVTAGEKRVRWTDT